MNPIIQSHKGSWPLTRSSAEREDSAAPSTTSAPGKVYNFEQHRFGQVKPPAGYSSIDEVIEATEANPRRKAALERARGKIANHYHSDEGDTVRTVRLRLGWSQTKLAELLGTSQSHVARIERGSENVAWETMRKLCSALQVDMNKMDGMLSRQRDNFEGTGR